MATDPRDPDSDWLSAEPLVGLKLGSPDIAVLNTVLSAEPLVGLKRRRRFRVDRARRFQPNPSWV